MRRRAFHAEGVRRVTTVTAARLSPAQFLDRVFSLLNQPGGWTRGAESRDADGRRVSYLDKRAVSFDLRGAVFRVGMEAEMPIDEPVSLLEAAAPGCFSPEWNDARYRAKREVLNIVLNARNAARKPEGSPR
jgi:hypothetical protein